MPERPPRTLTPLSDDQLVAIASAPPEVTAAALAAQLGAPYATVWQAQKRFRREGWVCRLAPRTCPVCGGLLLTTTHRSTRALHPGCVPAANAARQRQYRREGRARKSTPYVRRWRAAHREELAAEREREKAQQRER